MCVLSCFSRVRLFATPWTAVCQAPPSMGFSRQEYWNGLPCPPPGDLPDLGIQPTSLMSPALAGVFFTTAATAAAKSLQSCPTLRDPIDGSPSGSSISGILQARTLERVAISFSNACMHAKLLQSCLTLCDPMDSSPPGSSVHGTLQARILEWVAISFSIRPC